MYICIYVHIMMRAMASHMKPCQAGYSVDSRCLGPKSCFQARV